MEDFVEMTVDKIVKAVVIAKEEILLDKVKIGTLVALITDGENKIVGQEKQIDSFMIFPNLAIYRFEELEPFKLIVG